MNRVLNFLEPIFAKTYFYKLNKFLYFLSLKGLGVANNARLTDKADEALLKLLFNKKQTEKLIVFDVGANKGDYVKKVLDCAPNANVYAFEPHPTTFQKLLSLSKSMRNLYAINKGCGDRSGKLKFFDHANADGSEHASLIEDIIIDLHKSDAICYDVEVTTIDMFCSESNITKIDLLKIDTEGYEFNVLNGAINTIKNNLINYIYFEFNITNTISKVFMKDFIKLLPQYSFYRVLPDGLLKIETDKILLTEIFGFQNILAVNNHINHHD